MRFARLVGERYYDDKAKMWVIKVKPTLMGWLFPRHILIMPSDFKELKVDAMYWF